jgi:hypothetical protein
MGACQSRAAVVPVTGQISLQPIEKELHVRLLEFRDMARRFKGCNPFLLGLDFIHEMNERRAVIQALLTRIELEGIAPTSLYHTYFNKKDAALKEEIRERFHDGRIRVAAEVARVYGVMELLMPTAEEGRGGSALF